MLNQFQNSVFETIIFALVLVTIIIFVMVAALPLFIKKGIDAGEYIKNTNSIVDKAEMLIDAADMIFPGNPAINILKLIEDWVKKGVHGAEQLYIASQLSSDERKEKAKETIYAVFKLVNIKITPELEKIIDGSIEAEVLALGHKKSES